MPRPRNLPAGWTKCLVLFLLPISLRAQPSSPDLYVQATSAMLNRSFPSPQVEFLLLDLRTRKTVALRWSHPEDPVPVGSLLKPFVALAYGQMNSIPSSSEPRNFPVVYCHGRRDGCWRAAGHGPLGLEHALAESCNAYFLALSGDLVASANGQQAIERVSAAYGLPPPPAQPTPGILIGVTPQWRISPLALARAYAALAVEPDPTASRLLTGMSLAAELGGTAARVGPHPGGVFAKTGTAPCVPSLGAPRCVANGDGLTVVIFPAQTPHFLLLVRQRGTTGAHAAEVAGQMISQLDEAHAQAQ